MRSRPIFVTGALYLAAAAGAQTVQTTNGTIQGGKCDSTDVDYYFSIPFAQPPIGDLRFAAPQPFVSSFRGTLDGTSPAPSCIQFSSSYAETGPQSEDWYVRSLSLDIQRATLRYSGARLPLAPALIAWTIVSSWIFGPPALQLLTPTSLSKYGFTAAAMRPAEFLTRNTRGVSPL
jgi:hypothetical protein